MKRMWKKALTLILSCALAAQLLPMSVLAAGGDSYSDELMDALTEICGSEEEAEAYYDWMEENGLIDSSGNLAESWTITMDGEDISLDEIRELLASDDCDKSRTVEVDGTSVTLEDLETMIEIEDYLSYLEETYFSEQEWSDEQLANLDDLVNQIQTEGIEVVDADGGTWTGSVNHNVRLNVEVNDAYVWEDNTFNIEITPSEAQTEDITFTWRTVDGSVQADRYWNWLYVYDEEGWKQHITADEIREMLAEDDCDLEQIVNVDNEDMTLGELAELMDADEWTVTIPAGSTGTVQLWIEVGDVQGRVDGYSTFLVQIYDTANALIEYENEEGETVTSTRWELEESIRSNEDFRYRVDVTQKTDFEQGDFAATLNSYIRVMLVDGYRVRGSWGNWSQFKPCLNGTDYTSRSGAKAMIDYGATYSYISKENTALTFDLSTVDVEGSVPTLGVSASVGDIRLTRVDVFGDSRYKSDTNTSYKVSSTADFYDNTSAHDVTLTHRIYSRSGYSLGVTVGDSSGKSTYTSNTYNYPSFNGNESGSAVLVDSTAGDGGVSRGGTVKVNTEMYNVMYRANSSRYGSEANTKQDYLWCFFYPDMSSFDVTLTLWDTNQAANATLSATEGTYYAGQSIPIVATFDYPMEISEDMYIEVNGQTLYPEEIGTTAETCTFLYKVPDLDITSLKLTSGAEGCSLTALGANGIDVNVSLKDEDVDFSGVSIETPDKSAAVTGMEAEIEDPFASPVMTVTVDIIDDAELTEWLVKDLVPDEATGIWTSQSLTILYDGETYPLSTSNDYIQGGTLTAEIPIPLNTAEDTVIRGAELLIDGNICIGMYATAEQAPAVFLTEEDMTATVSVYQSDGETPYTYTDETYTIWLQDAPSISAAVELADKEWSFGDTGKTTVLTKDSDGNYAPADADADFIWWIGNADGEPDTSVANIDAAGKITPVGTAGTAHIYLTALNGDNKTGDGVSRAVTVAACQFAVVEDENGETADPVKVDGLRFDLGLTPFLYIPYSEVSSIAGQELTIYWTSNLCDKNGEDTTRFSITVSGKDREDLTDTCTGTASDPASGYTIPGSFLTYSYDDPESNIYTFTVSTRFEGVEYSATATITLQPAPATISLSPLESYYIADDAGSVNVGWDIESFEYFEGIPSGEFELQITKGDGDYVYATNDPGTGAAGGHYSGSYTLNIADVIATDQDVTSYREIYTVTVAAKNGGDSTWSYDSFLLYVYDRDALDIWVNGESADGVTLSNVKAISEMTQDEIIALNRDINLKAMISINYGEYAWAELSDQIAWASSDSSIAAVTYQQGTLYENIENYSYTSYRPATEFGVTGLSDGTVTITAEHTLSGISDSITVDVERLDNQLYLFQCYPQVATTLFYTNGNGEEKTVTSDADGAAAIYEESGIASDVYCQSEYDGYMYLGTFYNTSLKSGEGDWTLLERYPCNNMTLHRAAYAYMYIKNPDGTPYTDDITIRGGVYVDGEYVDTGLFDYNGEQNGDATQAGNEDYTITLGEDGRLEITMDQTQWGLDTGAVQAWNSISYIFKISLADDETGYYPMFVTVDAAANEEQYVEDGEAIVTFRENTGTGKHPFIAGEAAGYGYGSLDSVLDASMNVGPSTAYPVMTLNIVAMWWGEENVSDDASLQIFTEDGTAIGTAESKHAVYQETYPFIEDRTTTYTVTFDEESLEGILGEGETVGLYLEYYKDGRALSRRETLPQTLINMIGVEDPVKSDALADELSKVGTYLGTDASGVAGMSEDDRYVGTILNLVAGDDYTKSSTDNFKMCIAPTPDASKFKGLIEFGMGSLNDQNVSGVYSQTDTNGKYDVDPYPGLSELLTIFGVKTKDEYLYGDKRRVQSGDAVRNFDFGLSGNMEVLIYYDSNVGKWRMEVLEGGFGVGGGMNYTFNYNVPGMPFTVSFTAGGTMEVKMDALSVAYENVKYDYTLRGTEYLTELRIYLYMKFFAGIGIDYAVVAMKVGVYGQVDLDTTFRWLNRPTEDEEDLVSTAYPKSNDTKYTGTSVRIDGTAGIEVYVKLLFFKYEQILYSYTYNFLNMQNDDWDTINDIWDANEKALDYALKNLDPLDVTQVDVDGVSMAMVNLAPTKLDVDYLKTGSIWESGIQALSLDQTNGLAYLNENAYEFADPLVTEDGKIVAFLGVPDSYTGENPDEIDSSDVSAMFAVKSGDSYINPLAIDDGSDEDIAGFGDDELSLAGNGDFAVAAWTRQMTDIAKDDGAVLTDEDQRMMMDGTDICVALYDGSGWTTTRIENGGADLAPVVATNGSRAVVAWRSVSSYDGTEDITDFNKSDMILYQVYDRSTGEWSETQTLYNGTSGNVKGITAEMLSDGTAAVAYALDTDGDTDTITDREIVYAVINSDTGEVDRDVRATTDNYLDENPQLTTVKIGGQERFLLGWYTEQSVEKDKGEGLNGNFGAEDGDDTITDTSDTTSDIRLIDFDAEGNATQQMPDSISSAATDSEVSITSDFAFTKGAGTIDDLSIVWVERAEGETADLSDSGNTGDGDTTDTGDVERDVLKAVKFYTYGENNSQISFTSAVDLAEMEDSTLIDFFDAYTTDGETIKAVIMGTTYGADGVVEKTDVGMSGNEITYYVPSSVTSMYTATETYENTVEAPDFLADFDTLKLGAKTEIWFDVVNTGVDPITSVTIAVGDDPDSVTTFSGLNILPGSEYQTYADYRVPSDNLKDEMFTVTATFSDGSTNIYEGIIYMNKPDLQVTDTTIIREEDGERDILIKLNNKTDAALGENSGSKVRVSFYTDSTYENEFAEGYGLDAFEITDPTELKMIDEGGYSKSVTYDIGRYMADVATAEGEESGLAEIPEEGVNVYVLAEVVDAETDEVLNEPNSYNNYGSVTGENLYLRTGDEVSITSTVDVSDTDEVTVTVDLQNNRLTETTTGNVIVTLIAEDGSIMAQQQSYDGEKGLLTLTGEQKATEVFTFEDITAPFTVSVVYVDMILDDGEDIPEGLDTLLFPSLDENITVDSFVWDEEQKAYVYDVTVDTLTQMSMIAIARDAEATITVNGEKTDFYTVAKNLDLVPGETNVITITVTNRNGVETSYILTVYDDTNTVAGSVIWDDAEDQDGVRPEEVTVRLYADGEEIDSTTVTAEDDWSYEFTNLPIYSDGEEIVYSVTQDPVDSYTTTYDGYDIVNTYIPEQTSVSVTKYWEDEDDQDGIRPDSVTIQLCADGKDTGETLTLSGDNDWQGTFENLDKYKDGGEEIVYTVEEANVPDGYTSTVLAVGDDFEYTVINEHTPTAADGSTSGGGSGSAGSSGDGSTSGGSTVYPDSSGSSGGTGSTGNSGNTGSSGSTGSSEKLPQTGQLNWPIWVFGGLGVIILGIGIFLVLNDRKKRKQADITE